MNCFLSCLCPPLVAATCRGLIQISKTTTTTSFSAAQADFRIWHALACIWAARQPISSLPQLPSHPSSSAQSIPSFWQHRESGLIGTCTSLVNNTGRLIDALNTVERLASWPRLVWCVVFITGAAKIPPFSVSFSPVCVTFVQSKFGPTL